MVYSFRGMNAAVLASLVFRTSRTTPFTGRHGPGAAPTGATPEYFRSHGHKFVPSKRISLELQLP